LELRARKLECLFQAIESAELNVAKAFRLPLQFVLNDADAGDLATSEEVANITFGRIERKVAQMGGIRGLRRKRKLLAGLNGESSIVAF
jgi:hypothetical protein